MTLLEQYLAYTNKSFYNKTYRTISGFTPEEDRDNKRFELIAEGLRKQANNIKVGDRVRLIWRNELRVGEVLSVGTSYCSDTLGPWISLSGILKIDTLEDYAANTEPLENPALAIDFGD